MRICHWSMLAPEKGESTGAELLGAFDVELDNERIRMMRLWHVDDRYEVRCDPEHQVEMSADVRKKITELAVSEYMTRAGRS